VYQKLSEALKGKYGSTISLYDYVYLRFFHSHGIDFLKNKTVEESMVWMFEYYPDKSDYRDIILLQMYREGFEKIPKELQSEILALFDSQERSVFLRNTYYDGYKSEYTTLEKRLNFLLSTFPEVSKERDNLLEDILATGSSLDDFTALSAHFSENSRDFQRKESIAHGTVIAIGMENTSPMDKYEITLWLLSHPMEKKTEKQNLNSMFMFSSERNQKKDRQSDTKPRYILQKEDKTGINLDELQDSLKIASVRFEVLDSIFSGNKGLFS